MSTPEIMTAKEVSSYLRVSERTVLDWAQKGEIPAGKLGSSWRFKRTEVESWLDDRLKSPAKAPTDVDLKSAIEIECVDIIEGEMNKTDALNYAVSMFCSEHKDFDSEELSQAVFYREELMSTGIGLGLAVPHVRLPKVDSLKAAALIVRDGVADYETLDDEPVRIIFLIVAGQDQQADYLKFLSGLSQQLKNDDYRFKLINTNDRDSFYLTLLRG